MDELAVLDGFHAAIHDVVDSVEAYCAAWRARGFSEVFIVSAAIHYHWVLSQQLDRANARAERAAERLERLTTTA